MRISKKKLKKIIEEELQNVLNEARPGYNAPKEETVATFFDDPAPETINDPWLVNPETGDPWYDWDPLDPDHTGGNVFDPQKLHPEDRVEYYQNFHDYISEELGDSHPLALEALNDVHRAQKGAHEYAAKYNLKGSDYYQPPEPELDLNIPDSISIDPSIEPWNTESFGSLLNPDAAAQRLYYTPTEVTESIKKNN